MKRIFTFGLLVAAAFALTNCAQKESYAPEQGATKEFATFEVVANLPVETKTYNDGISTKWSDNDQLHITFVKEDGTSAETDNAFDHVGNGRFEGLLERKIIEGFLSSFRGTKIEAVYPVGSDGTIPASTVQNGFDSMAHLAGTNCPLRGEVALSWQQNYWELITTRKYTIPEIMLQHLTSVVEVAVTNNTASAIDLNKVDFLVNGEVKASTTVESEETLPAGKAAKVYVVVEPFTSAEADQLSFTVNDTFVKNIKATSVTFTAGNIKKVNFEVK